VIVIEKLVLMFPLLGIVPAEQLLIFEVIEITLMLSLIKSLESLERGISSCGA
jgi:hypothetical protein